MFAYRIIGIGIIGSILSLLIKRHRPEMAMAVPILTSVVILMMCIPYLSTVISAFEDIADRADIEFSHMRTVIKIIGVSYICQFGSDICQDAGEKTISSKIELGGKIIIITLSMPIIYSLLELVGDIISF